MKYQDNHTGLTSRLQQLALAALLTGITTAGAQAQALNYPLANAQNVAGTYTDLGTAGTAISTTSTDDANSAEQTIGFNFPYNGATMDRFILNTNGFLKLGTAGMTAPTANLYTVFAQSNSNGALLGALANNVNLLSPFNFDLLAGTSAAEYRMATTGTAPNRVCTVQWKNVADKAKNNIANGTLIPTQYTNMSFQVKMYENGIVEFVYGPTTVAPTSDDNFKYVQTGIKGSGQGTDQILRVTKGSVTAWDAATISAGPITVGATGAFNIRQSVPNDNGRTFRFTPTLPNDAGVAAIYTLTQLRRSEPHTVRAVVRNGGTNALTNVVATLNVTGVTTFTNAQTIASLAPGATATVTFASYTPAALGNNAVAVSLSGDDNSFNNTRTETQVVNATTYSYSTPATASSATGFPEDSEAGFGTKYTIGTATTITGVRAFVFDAAASGTQISTVGQTLYGIVVNPTTGAVLAESAPFVVAAADANRLHTFTLTTPVVAPAGDYVVGMVQVSPTRGGSGERFFPMGVQAEDPLRPGTFYTMSFTSNTTVNLSDNSLPTATVPIPTTSRYIIDAIVASNATATSAALKRAVSVYPNPSNTGEFNLEIRGANAKQGLTVEVTNMLGQRVYTGTAKDNFSSQVNLSSLASGIYNLKVLNGQEYTQQQISIVK